MKVIKNILAIMLAGIAILLYVNIPLHATAQTNTLKNAIGVLDDPISGSTLRETQNIRGWFLDESGVEKIEVLVDGALAGQATYGDARPDVLKAYPHFNNGNAGFHYALDTTRFSDGQHTVSIRILRNNGIVTSLPDRIIRIQNTEGVLDDPVSAFTLRGTQNVRGWFLDESGVEKIEVLVDGALAGQATYGDARPDVLKAYPHFNNGNAGFHYALDTTRFSDGQHTVSIRILRNNGIVTSLPDRIIRIQNTEGVLDDPVSAFTLRGTQNVRGWFLDESGVEKIEVLVDGALAGQATYGDARPDVLKAYPHFNNGNAGFHYALDTTRFSDGQHTVSIRILRNNGIVTSLPDRIIRIQNTEGVLDDPVSKFTLRGTQNVRGWFLDESGVEKIEVLVDGTLAGQAAYGDARPDVLKAYPHFNNGNAGFHFALDTTRFSDGQHTVSIRILRNNGIVTSLPDRIIRIQNTEGVLDDPVSEFTLRGTQNVRGWFLDESGVEKIEVLVDGTLAGQATYGDARPDVLKAYPHFNNGNAGFHYALDSTRFSDGQHTVSIRIFRNNGIVTSLPDRIIRIENTLGFLDNPIFGSTLRGTQNVRGWFVIPSGVANIEVLVDGSVAGQATYGDERSDVQEVYPEYNNGNSGFHYALDTTRFSDGLHTVTIRVSSKNGIVTTMPERTIRIENTVGILDDPVSASTLRGTQNVRGWFLNQSGVANIEVLVDGIFVGQATYGDARPDVQEVYPEFNNKTAGFHYNLDTTRFSYGQHTISIKVTASNGDVTTLPARTITINQSKTVFIDPGHGGSDPGAVAGGYRESDLNLTVAKKVQSLLIGRGYNVIMSRNSDTYVGLYDRPQMANNLAADIFVSIHTNSTGAGATSATGIESYYYKYDPNYPSKINGAMHNNPDRILKSVTLTSLIQENMVSYTGANDRGTKGDTLAVIRESAMPATLLELGFINNASDRQKLFTDSYQNTLAKAIADGIDEYFRKY